MNLSIDIFNVTDLNTAYKMYPAGCKCFDIYKETQDIGDILVFKPAIYHPSLDEFIDEVEKITGIRIHRGVYKLPEYFWIEYPEGYSEEQIYALDYLFHQFMRIPAAVVNATDYTDEELEERFSTYQEMLDWINEEDSYFAFCFHFDYREFLSRLKPNSVIPFDEKQSDLVFDIMSPVTLSYKGVYLNSPDTYYLDWLELLAELRPEFLPEHPLYSEIPVPIYERPADNRVKVRALKNDGE